MNYKETLDYIHSLGMFSHTAGLERIKSVLEKLGNPQNALKAIHIAGTNGKGSVSAMLASTFITAGQKTGLFISPFIIDFRERIQINNEYISEADLAFYAERVRETGVALTEFEFITALAFLYFKENEIDILVCETGLGGRLDATNTLDNLICAVITKIGLDHTAVLGDSIEKITEEKCGILRDCPTVTSNNQPIEALNVIKAKANELIIPRNAKIINQSISGNTFIYKGESFETSLWGDYQIENALIAIETLKICKIPYNIIYEGLKNASFPARLEVLSKKPLIVLDGAHNPDGALALSRELVKFNGSVTAIIGMMKDKNIDEVLKLTLKHCKKAIAVTVPDNPRSMSADELCSKAKNYCPCVTAQSIDEALKIAADDNVFIFGSLYLASNIRKNLI